MSKIRIDFVTNSSSSSFVIATKNKINEEMLLKCFDVNKKSPLYFLVKGLVSFIINSVEEKTLKEFLDDWYPIEEGELKNIFKKYNHVYIGDASNNSEYIESAFCEMDLNYEDENIKIIKEGGY